MKSDKKLLTVYLSEKTIRVLNLLAIALCLCGCNKNVETMYVEGIMVNEVFYEKSSQPMPAEVDESAIIGYIPSYTESVPAKNGETNISEDLIGAPFAKVEGGIAILYQNEWYLCTAETEESDTVVFHDRTFSKSDLSEETIEWIKRYNILSVEEQLAISGIPADLYKLCGYTEADEVEAIIENE